MPYKDKNKQREYQKEWNFRKSKGLPTRTKLIPSKEELAKRKKEVKRKSQRKRRAWKKQMCIKYLGNECFFCGAESPKYRLYAHRKDGAKHTKLGRMGKKELMINLESNEYVYLCYRCHKHVHFCMDRLNMSWKDISQKASDSKDRTAQSTI